MPMHRRAALRNLVAMFGAAHWLGAADDPLLEPANVLDFAPLAKAKLDPMAWDYLDGGSEDEQSLRDNRNIFSKLIIRPKALVDAVSLLASDASEGWVGLGALGQYMRRTNPGFSPQQFGHSGLLEMIRTYPELVTRKDGGSHWVQLKEKPEREE